MRSMPTHYCRGPEETPGRSDATNQCCRDARDHKATRPHNSPIIDEIGSTLGARKQIMAEMTVTPVAMHGFFVDGRWIEDGDIVEVRAPYDGSVIGRVVQGRREHAEAAIAAAVKAFGTTRRLPAFERQRVLRQISAAIAERKEEFARTLSQEAGKPIRSARTEVDRSIFTFN